MPLVKSLLCVVCRPHEDGGIRVLAAGRAETLDDKPAPGSP